MTLHREEVNSDSNGYIKNENDWSKVNNICKIYNIDLVIFIYIGWKLNHLKALSQLE